MLPPHATGTRRLSTDASSLTTSGRVNASSLREWTDAERRQFRTGAWTEDERLRFRAAVEAFPDGPWSTIARRVGTRTVRQTMTHAQKQQLRIERHARGLRPSGRKPRSQSDSSSNASNGGCGDGAIHISSALSTPSPTVPSESQDAQNKDTATGMLGHDDADEEIGALLDALTFDWVAVYLTSPAWLEFETSSYHSESAP